MQIKNTYNNKTGVKNITWTQTNGGKCLSLPLAHEHKGGSAWVGGGGEHETGEEEEENMTN